MHLTHRELEAMNVGRTCYKQVFNGTCIELPEADLMHLGDLVDN